MALQALSGTGSLRIGAEFIAKFLPGTKVNNDRLSHLSALIYVEFYITLRNDRKEHAPDFKAPGD